MRGISTFWFWFFAGPALALSIFALRGERQRARFVAERLRAAPEATVPSACVIVPVQGPQNGMQENLAALASLDYPDYVLILAARTAADIPSGILPRRITVVLVGSVTSSDSACMTASCMAGSNGSPTSPKASRPSLVKMPSR